MKKIVLVILLSMILSCALIMPRTENIENFLPRESDVPGWIASGVNKKDKDEIQAESPYYNLGIEEMITGNYSHINNDSKVINVSILRFSTYLDAYGFFSTQRGFASCPNSSCTDYFFNDSISIKIINRYIIYIKSSDEELFFKQPLKNFTEISQSYMKNILETREFNEELNILKESDDNIVIYSRNEFRRIPMLDKVIYTKWGEEDSSPIVFISNRETQLDTLTIFKKIVENKKYVIVNADDIQTAFKKDKDGKYIFLTVYKHWIAGCIDSNSLKESGENLKKVRNKLAQF